MNTELNNGTFFSSNRPNRILLVDDSKSIHNDIKALLRPPKPVKSNKVSALQQKLFDPNGGRSDPGHKGLPEYTQRFIHEYEIDDAYQGEQSVEMVNAAAADGYPYALVFMDVRMPPGIDGVQAAKQIWEQHPFTEIVLCTAYSDYSWNQMIKTLGENNHLLVLKKPFENIEIKQTALAMTTKWMLNRKYREQNKKLKSEIIEHRNAREEMARLRNMLKNIIDSMPSILVGVNTEGHVTQWNREAQLYTGTSPEMAHGKIISDLFPNFNIGIGKIHNAIKKNEPQKYSKVTTLTGNQKQYFDVTIYPLVADRTEGAVVRIDDITEYARIEEMMVQTEKMMSIGGLAAGMAHEINNPLAGILQSTQVISNRIREDLPKNRTAAEECGTSMETIKSYMDKRGLLKMVESISQSGKRASKIVNNMLSFSRKSKSEFSLHNTNRLLDATIELAENDYDLKKNYDFRKIKIIREYDPETPELMCEANNLQQVFLNIIQNSAHALSEKKGGTKNPSIFLRIKPGNNMISIEIEDNGPGMDDVVRKRVFEPFFTTKPVGKGTGLGLSVSYFIITKNHGGTMAVESTPGNGTKFIIGLPINNTEA